jgi:hypothetical protein
VNATDLLIEYEGDPAALDSTLMAMPLACALLGGPTNYVRHEGHYVARCFGSTEAFKFFVENQGYCRVLRALDELL